MSRYNTGGPYGMPGDPPKLSNRAGSSPSMLGSSASYGGASSSSGRTGIDHQERQNEEHLDLLTSKVGALKQISLQIESEVKDQNRWLTGMSNDFERTHGVLGATMGKLKRMAATQGSKYTFYMTFFVMFVFLVIYWLSRK